MVQKLRCITDDNSWACVVPQDFNMETMGPLLENWHKAHTFSFTSTLEAWMVLNSFTLRSQQEHVLFIGIFIWNTFTFHRSIPMKTTCTLHRNIPMKKTCTCHRNSPMKSMHFSKEYSYGQKHVLFIGISIWKNMYCSLEYSYDKHVRFIGIFLWKKHVLFIGIFLGKHVLFTGIFPCKNMYFS